MANTKITTNVIADGAITSAKLDTSGLSIPSTATATTQSAGDNSTKVATTAYVETAVSNLVSAAPAALDTLDELAAALGDDANFSTTVTNSIATKLPLAGGTLTGHLRGTTFGTNLTTTVGVGGTPADSNTAEVGPGYINLARDDIANAKQILFGKNGAVHSYLETTSSGLNIGGAKVGINKVPSTWYLDVDSSDAYVASFDGSNNTGVVINSGSSTVADIIGYSNSASTYNALNIRGASGTGLYIDTSNNVGIGTTNPASILHIEGDTNDWGTAPMLYFGSTSTANADVRDWAIGPADSNYGNFHFNVGASTGANPVAANNEVMVLTAAKRVGIKMTSPAYDLDVNGNFAFRSAGYAYDAAFYAYDSAAGTYLGYDTTTGGRGRITMQGAQDLLLQTNGGNVGIGVTDATETLHLSATAPEIKMANSSMNYHIRSYNNNFNIVPQNATYGLSMSSNGEVCVGNSTDSSSLRRARRFNVEGNGSNKDGVHIMNYNGANTYQCAYHMMTAAGSTIYAHIETSISTQSNIMFRVHFTGYNYGTSSVINMHGVGYAYQPSNAVIAGQALNNGGDSSQELVYYTSNNNRVVLRFKVGASSSYYSGFLLHGEFAQPTGYNHEFTVVNATWTSSSANQY